MIVACAISVSDLGGIAPDVLVLPERTTKDELQAAQCLSSRPVVVGAIQAGKYVQGYLLHNGSNRIADYLKTWGDDRALGSHTCPKTPVYEIDGLAIGALICRDCHDNNELRVEVLNRLCLSGAALKLLCIPADMHGEWFQGSDRIIAFPGVFVAVSNNTKPPNATRCKSLIADPQGVRLKTQIGLEAIHAIVP